MTVNAATLALVQEFEGFVNHAYPDPVSGGEPWTIGYGHTSAAGPPAVAKGMVITKAEADSILAADLAKFESAVRSAITVPVNENQVGACVSFAFNLGTNAFLGSTLLKKLNAGDYAGAALEFARWNHAGGQVIAGLTRRRAAETALFNTPAEAPVPPAPIPAPAPKPVPPVSQPAPAPAPQPVNWLTALLNLVLSLLKGLVK